MLSICIFFSPKQAVCSNFNTHCSMKIVVYPLLRCEVTAREEQLSPVSQNKGFQCMIHQSFPHDMKQCHIQALPCLQNSCTQATKKLHMAKYLLRDNLSHRAGICITNYQRHACSLRAYHPKAVSAVPQLYHHRMAILLHWSEPVLSSMASLSRL